MPPRPSGLPAADDRGIVFVPFGQGNFVNTDDIQLLKLRPIHLVPETSGKRSFHRVLPDLLFAADIHYGAAKIRSTIKYSS
jgi:hypothetical protein